MRHPSAFSNIVHQPTAWASTTSHPHSSTGSPSPSPARYHDKRALLQQGAGGGQRATAGESALARLQARVSQGDVKKYVVQTESAMAHAAVGAADANDQPLAR